MAALNQAETRALNQASALLDGVMKEGFDPNDDSPQGRLRRAKIKEARDGIRTVVTMKGYYPK
jgi:hypothetical protein